MYISSALESRELDKTAIEDFGLPGLVLMENAAQSIFRETLNYWPHLKNGGLNIFILGGPGQNGGDGWVLARLFQNLNHTVTCFLVSKPKTQPKGDGQTNLALVRRLNIPVFTITNDLDPLPDWRNCHLIIDALFGTGLSRPLEGQARRVISSVVNSPRTFKVLAVDLPSGLSSDTGKTLGQVLPADLTVSLGTFKQGFYLNQGPEIIGELKFGDIGLCPQMIAKATPKGRLLDSSLAKTLIPFRPANGHKGTFGHALLCGGSSGKTGALVLAALGAGRSGCGLVTTAFPNSLSTVFESKLTSSMTKGLPEENPGHFENSCGKILLDFMTDKEALGLGPGLGLNSGAKGLTEYLSTELPKPLVLDADALTNLSSHLKELKKAKGPRILTPHPGEAARLLKVSAKDIQEDRLAALRELAEQSGAVIVLKGQFSLIIEPSTKNYLINSSGNPALAVGGSGDLLTGLITGLLAQGLKPFWASALATFIHGLSGQLASENFGTRGLDPTLFGKFIPKAFDILQSSGPNYAV
jgi:NAD(P)H-hydrate epimerase